MNTAKIRILALPAVASLAASGLTACTTSSSQEAVAAVTAYVNAVAAGDAELAHELNPYSPILGADGIAASAAATHIEIVEIGDFEELDEGLVVPDPDAAPQETDSDSDADEQDESESTDWTGVDWSDSSWSGLESEEDAALEEVDTVVAGLRAGDLRPRRRESDRGYRSCLRPRREWRDAARLPSAASARGPGRGLRREHTVPAIAPAAIALEVPVEEPEETEESSWWGGDSEDEEADAEAEAVVRTASIGDAPATLSSAEPLLVLPGTYSVQVDPAGQDDLWAAPGTPEPTTAVLQPGGTHTIELAEAELTEAGRAEVHRQLDELASAKYDQMVTFTTSDREESCGILAPSGGWGTAASAFEDEVFTLGNTTLDNGGIVVTAASSNGAKGSSRGNGSSSTFADEAFCAGLESANAGTATVPVEVLSSALTSGDLEVDADGAFEATTPWTLAMTTTVTSFGTTDAAGDRVGYGDDPVQTTFEAEVMIEWTPSGSIGRDGTLTIGDAVIGEDSQ